MLTNFPYKTIIDRVITDEKGNILFGENPANVRDNIQIARQDTMIQKMTTQISNQQAMINKLTEQVNKQAETVTQLETVVDRANTQITNQGTMITELNEMVAKETTQITNQETIIDRLNEQFNVIMNGNTMELYGASTDTKPTTDIKIGTTFYEYDTQTAYMWTGNTWVVV